MSTVDTVRVTLADRSYDICVGEGVIGRLGEFLQPLRLGRRLGEDRYWEAGLTIADRLFDPPYLSTAASHQGLILHSVYHRPNGWNWQPGESSMWGDYHARELALYLLWLAEGGPYLKFWF